MKIVNYARTNIRLTLGLAQICPTGTVKKMNSRMLHDCQSYNIATEERLLDKNVYTRLDKHVPCEMPETMVPFFSFQYGIFLAISF